MWTSLADGYALFVLFLFFTKKTRPFKTKERVSADTKKPLCGLICGHEIRAVENVNGAVDFFRTASRNSAQIRKLPSPIAIHGKRGVFGEIVERAAVRIVLNVIHRRGYVNLPVKSFQKVGIVRHLLQRFDKSVYENRGNVEQLYGVKPQRAAQLVDGAFAARLLIEKLGNHRFVGVEQS